MAEPLHLYDPQAAADPALAGLPPDVILVHGSLDRAQSFGRVLRRLAPRRAVAYDRRGYAGSRRAGVAGLGGQIDDLLALADRLSPGRPLAVVGHSYGGDVALGAALRAPGRIAAVGAYEPPMPWLGFRRTAAPAGGPPPAWPAIDEDPGREAEHFYRRMVSDAAWERLSESGRAAIRADGPALVADLLSFRAPAPFDVTALAVPAVFGRGGTDSADHHRHTVAWLATNVPGAVLFEAAGAQHGAHFSHPDAFTALVLATLDAAAPATAPR